MTINVVTYTVADALNEGLEVTIPALEPYHAMLLDQYQAGEEGECIAHLDTDTPLDGPGFSKGKDHTIHVAFFPQASRGCVVDNAGATWTDAEDLEDTVRRYYAGELFP